MDYFARGLDNFEDADIKAAGALVEQCGERLGEASRLLDEVAVGADVVLANADLLPASEASAPIAPSPTPARPVKSALVLRDAEMRAGPGEEYEVTGIYTGGLAVIVVETAGDWHRLQNMQWVRAGDVDIEPRAPFATQTAAAQAAAVTAAQTAAAQPMASPTAAPVRFSGRGQQATGSFRLDEGLVRFRIEHDGERHFAVWLLDEAGQRVDLLVNEIGQVNVSKAVGIRQGGRYLLNVEADGSWTVTVE